MPVWVKFPNLPLECWTPNCLSKIASMFGITLQSDRLTSTMTRLSYARVLVEVNLIDNLPFSIKVLLPNGSTIIQEVVYETMPKFCKLCRVLSHTTIACPSAGSKPAPQDSGEMKNRSRGIALQKLCLTRDHVVRNIENLLVEQAYDLRQPEASISDWKVVQGKKHSRKHHNSNKGE